MKKPRHLKHTVCNRSSREGEAIRVVILHTTEGHNRPGVSDLQGLANFFDNPAVEASSHLGIDAEGNSIRMVDDRQKAWTAGNANAYSLNIEQVGFAAESKRDWVRNHHRGLYRVAVVLARWHRRWDIPLRHSTRRGVCQHKHVSGPGGHTDCGPGYPEAYVILWARLIAYRLAGKNKSLRARYYKRRVSAIQKRYGLRPDTELWKP